MVWPVSLSWFLGSGRRMRRPSAAVAGRHCPRFEGLEDRYLLTTVTTLADSGTGSLRDAIASTPAGGTITFQSNLAGTITLSSPLTLHNNLTLNGPGPLVITVSGGDTTGVFGIDGGVTATITGLTIAHGRTTGLGAGIANAGTLTVSTCVFSANTVTGGSVTQAGGGALSNSGTLSVDHSAFVGNTALTGINVGGGALLEQGTLANPAMGTLSDCTFANNQGITGGGIYTQNATVTIVDCTVAFNSTGPAGKGGGISIDSGSIVTLQNTLVAGNSAPNTPDISGLVSGGDHNLVGNGNGSAGLINGVNGNQVGTPSQPIDAKLAQPLINGGQTPTLALRPGSPAIAAGNPTGTPPNDQRGVARPTSGAVSIGAFEFQAPTPAQAFFAVGSSTGLVNVQTNRAGSLVIPQFAPFGVIFGGPVTVAVGDINGDGFPDLVVAAGAGNPQVKVYNGLGLTYGSFLASNPDALLITQFFAYGLNFDIGANVAVGSVANSGFADLVTGATAGNPQVKVYSGQAIANGTFNRFQPDASLLASFFAYGLNFNIGANVAVGDLSKTGFADVVTGATAGNPDVRVYSGQAIAKGTFNNANPDASLVAQFFPYALQFNVGAFVTVGDVNGDGFPDLITGASVGNPDVRVYNGQAFAQGTFDGNNPDASQLTQFFAFAENAGIGVSVAAHDFLGTGRADILTGATSGSPDYRVVSGLASGVEPPALNGLNFTFNAGLTPLYVGA
jgi:hypothetical protein